MEYKQTEQHKEVSKPFSIHFTTLTLERAMRGGRGATLRFS